jgi:hypothetical protein
MSLQINPGHVTAVLLADGWHHDVKGFDLDAYEYVQPHPNPDRDGFILLGGGREPLVPATGFLFTEPDGTRLYGPLTSILAIKATP